VGSDISILVFNPQLGAVVCERWLGGNRTLEAALSILARPAKSLEPDLKCWTDVLPKEVEQIAEYSYTPGATPAEVVTLAARFPTTRYAWMLLHDN
jgi:hypothetical protein